MQQIPVSRILKTLCACATADLSSGHGLSQAFHPAGPECAALGLGVGALPGPSRSGGRGWGRGESCGNRSEIWAVRLSAEVQLYGRGGSGLRWSRPHRVSRRVVREHPAALSAGLWHNCVAHFVVLLVRYGVVLLYLLSVFCLLIPEQQNWEIKSGAHFPSASAWDSQPSEQLAYHRW